ncbi:MAG: metallophosphoesterase [Paludibaculum sp.]
MAQALRILHISDLHARGSREGESWRRRRVLGEAWDRNLEEFQKDGPVHLVCFTGDAADWGVPEEFSCAGEFLSGVLEKLGIERDRLFVIPGNHDITRTVEPEAWTTMRTLLSSTPDTLDLARWIGGGRTPYGRSITSDTSPFSCLNAQRTTCLD